MLYFWFSYLLCDHYPYRRDIYRLGPPGRISGTDRKLDFCYMSGSLLSRHNNKCRQLDTVCPAKETGRYTPSNHDIRCCHRIVLVRVHGSHFRPAFTIHIHFMCQYLQKRIPRKQQIAQTRYFNVKNKANKYIATDNFLRFPQKRLIST